jgi:ribose-phosphate pyrophosphokinase
LEVHTFPDGESGLRFLNDVTGRDIALVCSLASPNGKFLPLAFAAAAARDLGARSVGLIAPYLCYMRQDRRFQSGEAITSRTFAELISGCIDWLITVDPHLHRYKSLDNIYSIPTQVLHAGPSLAAWIGANVPMPFLIGPDEESRQWVATVAATCGAPFALLQKQRLGDRDVRNMPPQLTMPAGSTAIVLDDIISSGSTMVEALRLLGPQLSQTPIAIGIHGVFAEGARAAILETGARLVTTNSVPGADGTIDLSDLIARGVKQMVHISGATSL